MDTLNILNIPYFKQGNKIHIKEKNKGKFTEYCDGEVTQNCIDKAKNSGNPTLKKRAIFAENSRSWKHTKGGQLIPKRKIGQTLDYDPKNPYHVHNNGEKIVITPEQYEKHKNEPYFASIRKQVEEHQAAYPIPEYTETPNPEYRKVYANVKARSNQHFKEHNFNGQTYREYSAVPENYFRNSLDGVVTDKQGNLYRPMTQADAGKGVTPMFTTTEREHRNGRNFDMSWVRVKTPDKTIKTLKQPLPVDRTYNVDGELDNAVNKYINDPNNIVNAETYSKPLAIQVQTINRTPNDDGIIVNEAEGWDPGTLKQSDWIKIFKPTMHPELFKLYSKDPDIWKFPTKQQALDNIQLKIN